MTLPRAMWRLTSSVFGLWLLGGIVETITPVHPFVYSFRAFGLVSPLVGLVLLALSVAALVEARRTRTHIRQALAAILLSVSIAIVPFFSLPYDPS